MRTEPRNRMLIVLIFLAVFGLLAASCSFDYGDELAQAQTTEEQPTAVFTDFTHRVVDRDRLVLEIHAARASTYSTGHRTELKSVNFAQYGNEGALAASGKADAATVYTDSENAEFRGHVLLESKSEQAVLEAEELTWVSDRKTISGGLERIVSVTRQDGAWVRGAGFSADLRRRTFSFQESTSGQFVDPDEEPGSP
jgi:LPS export ABC transporter protein LptC